MDLWDPAQYLLFDEMRARPAADLLARTVQTFATWRLPAPKRVFDLGCGPGKQVLLLARAFPEATVVGTDSSANMIQTAQESVKKMEPSVADRVQFQQATFEGFTESVCSAPSEAEGKRRSNTHTASASRLTLVQCFLSSLCSSAGGVDLLYTNAALHWASDHASLLPHLLRQVRADGGVFACSMPNNFREPSHTAMKDALEQGRFFGGDQSRIDQLWARQPNVHEDGASYYFPLLRPLCRHVDEWEVQFQQVISSPSGSPYHPVLEWTKSTALAPILAALPSDQERTRFQRLYSELLEQAYPYFEAKQGQKQVLFPFRRIFLVAVR